MMRNLGLTLAGGFCGAICRYLLGAPLMALMLAAPGAHAALPYDTLVINLSGALLLGMLFGLFEYGAPISSDVRLTLGTGFLGAYTTFSSYMVGTDVLLAHGRIVAGMVYLLGSMAGGMALALVGFHMAGAGWKRWQALASGSVAEELLGGGSRGDTSPRGRSVEAFAEAAASLPARGDGERWSR